MVEYCHQKYKLIILKKNIFKIRNKLINLKLDPQNIELKEPNKNIESFEVKIHIHPMLETRLIPVNVTRN